MRRYCAILAALALVFASGCAQPKPGTTPTPEPPPMPAPAPEAVLPPEPPQELLEAVPFAEPEEGPTEAWRIARRLFFAAYLLQLQGELEAAIGLYQRSIDTFPTAEAHTFLGWTYSWMGRYDEAIREAEQAIALDPEFGNPYNDIGVYLMALGRLDEAIPWLRRAMQAKRYASPHYPWLNLGHIWILKGEWGKALSSYEEVLRLAPEHPIPPIPVVAASPFLPPEEARNPGTSAERQAVTEAIMKYFAAWSTYDADALKDYTAPLTTEASIALLLRMAATKHAGVTTVVNRAEPLHLEGDMAVVKTSVSVDGESQTIWHLLQQTDGAWRVVVRLFIELGVSRPTLSH